MINKTLDEIKRDWIPKRAEIIAERKGDGKEEVIIKFKPNDNDTEESVYQLLRFFEINGTYECSVDIGDATPEEMIKTLFKIHE